MVRGACLMLISMSSMGLVKIGHRGACGYEPENTLRSFERAIELGVDMIELDVYCCASGELVIIHDDTLDRTTNCTGAVAEKKLAELKTCDAGKGERIPTLRELFDSVNRRVKINVELKGPNTAVPVAELIQEYVQQKGWAYDDFFVSSFDHAQVKRFKQARPEVAIGGLIGSDMRISKNDLERLPTVMVIGLPLYFATAELVHAIQALGMQVYVYTVNEPNDIARMKSIGVDGIFCNYPDRLLI